MSRIAEKYRNCFTTVDGKVVLKDLRDQFYDRVDMAGTDAHTAVVNAAQRDVLRYILDLMETPNE